MTWGKFDIFNRLPRRLYSHQVRPFLSTSEPTGVFFRVRVKLSKSSILILAAFDMPTGQSLSLEDISTELAVAKVDPGIFHVMVALASMDAARRNLRVRDGDRGWLCAGVGVASLCTRLNYDGLALPIHA